jgi:hypothetical protein
MDLHDSHNKQRSFPQTAVTCFIFFDVRTESLNTVYMSSGFKGLSKSHDKGPCLFQDTN